MGTESPAKNHVVHTETGVPDSVTAGARNKTGSTSGLKLGHTILRSYLN